ncbi:MAG: pyridoxal-phosphate dependent enzyme [Ignavibacteriaceae bacterium]
MKVPNKVKLANLPTPVEQLNFRNRKFFIKRDDYTGTDFSGNKIRKLEYLLYEAKRKKADIIFTCGGEQSNHCRATVSAAARLGIKTKLFLWGKDSNSAEGNLFLSKMFGAEISFLNKRNYENVNEIMFEEKENLDKKNKRVYVIPEGGSTTLAIWGYISFIHELKKQVDKRKVNGMLLAAGTGGTAAGILVGASLFKLPLKIFTINVLYNKGEITNKILQLTEGIISEYKLKCRIKESDLEIIDGYSKEGYKNFNGDKIALVSDLAKETGILLDPAYTGKAFTAYYDHFIKKNKTNKVMFLHSGGIYGAFAKRKKYLNYL